MRSLAHPADRDALLARLETLTPESRPAWGGMDVGRMLRHVADAMRMALGELKVEPGPPTLFRYFPLKQLALYLLPIPKGVPTARELLATPPTTLEADRAEIRTLAARFAGTDPGAVGPMHPFFGPMSARQWGVLQWRHTDHHLRQFGA